jgi:hypothetical protein
MKLDKIEIATDFKHLQIREIIQVPRVDEDGNPVLNDDGNPIIDSGGYHRRVLTPDMDVSGETQTIQQGIDENDDPIMKTVKEIAEELWTDEVKTAWTTFQAEQEAKMNPE